MKKVYVSGPYTGMVLDNVAHALHWAHGVAIAGAHPIVPHTSFPQAGSDWDEAMRLCKVQLHQCDAVLLIPGWEQSRGAVQEMNWAMEAGMQVFFTLNQLQDWIGEAA